jgi:hypothetical protein
VVDRVRVGNQPRGVLAARDHADVEAVEEEALVAEEGDCERVEVLCADRVAIRVVEPLADDAGGRGGAAQVAQRDEVAACVVERPPGVAELVVLASSSSRPLSPGPQTYSRESLREAGAPPPGPEDSSIIGVPVSSGSSSLVDAAAIASSSGSPLSIAMPRPGTGSVTISRTRRTPS